MRKAAMVFSLVAAASTAQAADWRVATDIAETSAGRALGFIDVETIERTDDRVTFWAFLIYGPEGRSFDNAIFRFEADCGNHAYEGTRVHSYLGDQMFESLGPTERGRAAPASTIFGLIEAACGSRPLGSERVPDPYGFTRRHHRTGWTS